MSVVVVVLLARLGGKPRGEQKCLSMASGINAHLRIVYYAASQSADLGISEKIRR